MSKGKIIKTKFLCKNGSRTGPAYGGVWIDRFIEGKWYDGEYETWGWKDGYECNNGWRRYWIVNENGVREEIHRAHFNAIFETNIEILRDEKINQIMNNGETN
jgi:hypothetical protein